MGFRVFFPLQIHASSFLLDFHSSISFTKIFIILSFHLTI